MEAFLQKVREEIIRAVRLVNIFDYEEVTTECHEENWDNDKICEICLQRRSSIPYKIKLIFGGNRHSTSEIEIPADAIKKVFKFKIF